MYSKTLLVIIISFLSLVTYAKSTFHLIVVYDSQNTDDVWAVKDKDNLVKNCTKYANLYDLTFKKTVYKQHEVSRGTLENKIRNLNVGSDDVIWFAYIGHRQNASTYSKFPKIELRSSNNMTQDELHKLIKAKEARLTISIFDLYQLTRKRIVDTMATSIGDRNPLGYIRLFKKGKADIKATAIKKEHFREGNAIRTREFGGLFTYSFIESIDEVCNSAQNINSVTWKNVIAKAKTKTNKLANNIDRTQIPYIELTNENYKIIDSYYTTEDACIMVEEGDTKESIIELIILFRERFEAKEITITPNDLKTRKGELVGSRELIVGECISVWFDEFNKD
jgi:hypothetical protein